MTGGGATRQRIAWLDTARGIAILLVILYHAILFTQSLELDVGPWATSNRFLSVLRMPLFFLISGFLVAKALDRPPATARPKVGGWLWVYLIWSLINMAVFSIVEWRRDNPPADSPWDLLGIVGWPTNGLWYLYALAVFLVVLLLTRRLPAVAVVGVAAVLSAAVGTEAIPSGNFAIDQMGRYFVFFALGARFPAVVAAAESWFTPKRIGLIAPIYLLVFGAVAGGAYWTSASVSEVMNLPGVRLLVSLLVVGLGIALSVVLTRSMLHRPLGAIGRATLPIYVAHEIVLGCLTAAVIPVADDLPGRAGLILPLLLASATVVLARALGRAFNSVPGLYESPRWLARRLSATAQPGAEPVRR
ncbi:acyltransferase family protein [Blastococcus sp. SYSU D00813]